MKILEVAVLIIVAPLAVAAIIGIVLASFICAVVIGFIDVCTFDK